jgi:hypothetical protein
LNVVGSTNISTGFLGNAMMNKIMGVATINDDDDLHFLNVDKELEGLERREASKGMQRNHRFNLWLITVLAPEVTL